MWLFLQDYSIAESFVVTLKTECFGGLIVPTKAAAKLMVFDYIETFYNRRPRHRALGYRSPLQFEEQLISLAQRGLFWGRRTGGETCLERQVGSSRLGCEQLQRVVQAPGNNPVESAQTFTSTLQ